MEQPLVGLSLTLAKGLKSTHLGVSSFPIILITSVIDNLVKGASGQAIQNLNLIMGWEEDLGLLLKASVF